MPERRPSRRQVIEWGTAALALALPAARAAAAAMRETPFFKAKVKAGKLPAVAERIPSEPAIAETATIGRPGGELRMLMASPKDAKMMNVYGYARLVGYTPSLKIEPDILKSIDVEKGRVFTLYLRKGMRWSDGQPFTAEDFRYWFEDVAQNPELSPSGLPVELLPQGQAPRFEVLDEVTVRYTWPVPNPLFLPELAGAYPLYIFCPAHYLKQFNPKYARKEVLAKLVKKARVHNWGALHNKMDAQYRDDNRDLPTVDPWVLKTKYPSTRLVFERNPYYYRIDDVGHQLPYIDRVVVSIASSEIIPAKTGAGESDLQARYLRFDNYTFLKQGEKQNGYAVRLWTTGPGSQLALYPNLNVNDPVWKKLLGDVRFRRALSLAVNRHEINEAIFFGLAIEGQNTLLPQSPLYKAAYREAWAQYDPALANRLLDEIGLTRRGGDDIRLLPDGRPMDLIVEDSGELPDTADVLELIRDSWRHIGIRLFARPLQLTLFRRRIFAGETVMSIDKGIENGLADAAASPHELAPTSQEQLEWPKWGQYFETKGKAGISPGLPSANELKSLYEGWLGSVSSAQQAETWEKMLTIWADEVFTIGTVAGVLQPVVISDKLRNIPAKGIYNWNPGAYFGMYKPDQFWLEEGPAAQKSASAAAPGQ